MAESKITVRIDTSDLEQFRGLVERAERAAERTRVLTALRLPLKPGACPECVTKDQRIAKLERAVSDRQGYLRNNYKEIRRLRDALERESAEHFATRIALRDALRNGAAYAKEAGEYAKDLGQFQYHETANEDAAQWDAARAALGLDEIAMPAAPEPARRRRFRAGDHVRLPAQTTVYSAVLDENDAGSVAIEVSRNELNCISTSALTLIEPTHRARRNRELAFHFHRWSISTDADAMDSVPEFVRVAAEQLLRDPFGTEYGSVLAGPETGGAK